MNKEVPSAAVSKFRNHLWYLSVINDAISVFDAQLSFETRQNIMYGILSRQAEEINPPKKGKVLSEDISKLKLGDLTTTNSLKFFECLGMNFDFLHVPVTDWKNNESYLEGRNIVSSLQVVNDHAERGVKFLSDFNRSVTIDEKIFQDLLLWGHSMNDRLIRSRSCHGFQPNFQCIKILTR